MELTDDQWAVLEPLIPVEERQPSGRGRPWRPARDVFNGILGVLQLSTSELERMITLMSTYHDTPMDLADASLVAVADSRHLTDSFSLDSDFYIYRLAKGSVLNIIR